MSTIIGRTKDYDLLSIGDYERRSGLYILGLPRTGKSWLMVNLMMQDIVSGHGLFFLDPHGDAIDDLIEHCSSISLDRALFFDPEDRQCTFGINLLEYPDVTDLQARANTFTKAKGVFDKLWKNTFEEKPWLQLILQNTFYTFIENQGHTLTELPLFFRDSDFREFLISRMKYNRQVYDYWTKTFTAKSKHDRDEQMEAAQTRAEIMLAHPIVRDVVGQTKTTIDFNKIMEERKTVLIKLSTHLSYEVKKIIGTILISELLQAVQHRINRHQFCIYIDEFQNFAGFEDFATLITQAPKFGIATTLAHHERYGQFADSPKVAGATAAIANKVLFQITPRDAFDFAPEFAKPPPTEIRREPELIISQEPVAELLRGHRNPEIRAFVSRYLRPLHEEKEDIRDDMEFQRLILQDMREETALHRLDAQEAMVYRKYGATTRALQNAESSIYDARLKIESLMSLFKSGKGLRWLFRALNKFLSVLMQGEIKPNKQEFRDFLISYARVSPYIDKKERKVLELYISVSFGDPEAYIIIPFNIAADAGLFADEVKALELRLEAKWRWENLIKERTYGEYNGTLSLPCTYQGEAGRNGEVKSNRYNGPWATRDIAQERLEADTRIAGKDMDQIKAKIVYKGYRWSCYALFVDYALLVLCPPLLQVIRPYLSARFKEGDSPYDTPTYGKVSIEYSKVVSRLQQENLFWCFSTDESHEQLVQFLINIRNNIRNVATPAGFIEKYKEGAFVIFVLLANARFWYQEMKRGEEKGYGRNPFELIMPNGENIEVYPILEAINKTILAMPDYLPARILTEEQALAVKMACVNRLAGTNAREAIDDFVRFCELLMLPENHTLIYSSQFVHKEVNIRTEVDMVGEVARKLINLPSHTAYVKLTHKQEGQQAVLKRQIQTFELPAVRMDRARLERIITNRSYSLYYQERRKIEEDLRLKEKKRLGLSLDAPPPAETQHQEPAAPPPGDIVVTETQGELSRPALQLPEPDAPPPASLAARTAEDTLLKREDQTSDAPLEEPKFDEEAEDVRQEGAAALIAVTDRPVPTSKEALPKDEAAKVQTANPPEAQLLYRSNFYLPDDKWLEGESRDGKIRSFRRDGYYHMVLSLSEWWEYRFPRIPLASFRVHVDAEFLTHNGSHVHFGVVFRVNNDHDIDSFYCFAILPSGNYGLFIRVNEHWETILDYRPSEFIRRGDSSNSLLVEMAGQKITLGVNGHCLATLLDSRLPDGCVGLFAGTRSNDSFVEARFRDFRLYGSLSSKP
jgi:hypothetical protein